jgi:hypothetical protein
MNFGLKNMRLTGLNKRWTILALVIFNIALFTLIFHEGIKIARERAIDYLSITAKKEQLENADKLMANLSGIEENTQILEKELRKIEKVNKINLETKTDLLKKMEKLEEDNLRLTDEFNSYNSDESIKINVWRDKNIDKLFSQSWILRLMISRMVRSYEETVFRGYLTGEQRQIIKYNMDEIYYQVNEIKKQYLEIDRSDRNSRPEINTQAIPTF